MERFFGGRWETCCKRVPNFVFKVPLLHSQPRSTSYQSSLAACLIGTSCNAKKAEQIPGEAPIRVFPTNSAWQWSCGCFSPSEIIPVGRSRICMYQKNRIRDGLPEIVKETLEPDMEINCCSSHAVQLPGGHILSLSLLLSMIICILCRRD